MTEERKELPYDPKNPEAIYKYARALEGKTVNQVIRDSGLPDKKIDVANKGSLGQILEAFYFYYKPNSKKEADFSEAGLELKSTPLKILKNGKLVSKERLVLSIIDYMKIIKETWPTASVFHKNGTILLIFYLHRPGKDIIDYTIKKVILLKFSKEDLSIIKEDWEKIVAKISAGKAHELSEGDTFYLGACTKGADAHSMRKQPFSDILAKQRAFSLKQKYVNLIIQRTSDTESILKSSRGFAGDFETMVAARFKPFVGKTPEEIAKLAGVSRNEEAKGNYATLARAIMGVKKTKVEEFEKAGVTMKVIRLKRNGMPVESISFPYIRYDEIVNEVWEESTAFEQMANKFFFVVFQEAENGDLQLKGVTFWNIPYSDLQELKRTWEKTIECIRLKRYAEFPKISRNRVAHVRPHGANAKDVTITPHGEKWKKNSFWFNAGYIKEQLEQKELI